MHVLCFCLCVGTCVDGLNHRMLLRKMRYKLREDMRELAQSAGDAQPGQNSVIRLAEHMNQAFWDGRLVDWVKIVQLIVFKWLHEQYKHHKMIDSQ